MIHFLPCMSISYLVNLEKLYKIKKKKSISMDKLWSFKVYNIIYADLYGLQEVFAGALEDYFLIL